MTATLLNPRERTRFVRFAIVGVIGTVVDFGVANLLVHNFHAPLVLAGTISFICAIVNNFTWNRIWTYPDSRSKPLVKQLVEFSVVSLAGLLIRIPILVFVEPLAIRFFSHLPMHLPYITREALAVNLTLAVAIIIVLFWNFFANRYWTYSDVE